MVSIWSWLQKFFNLMRMKTLIQSLSIKIVTYFKATSVRMFWWSSIKCVGTRSAFSRFGTPTLFLAGVINSLPIDLCFSMCYLFVTWLRKVGILRNCLRFYWRTNWLCFMVNCRWTHPRVESYWSVWLRKQKQTPAESWLSLIFN